MIERGEQLGLALKSDDAIRIARHLGGQHLARDRPLQVAVGRATHLTHAAGTDGGEDLIGTDAGAGDDGQR